MKIIIILFNIFIVESMIFNWEIYNYDERFLDYTLTTNTINNSFNFLSLNLKNISFTQTLKNSNLIIIFKISEKYISNITFNNNRYQIRISKKINNIILNKNKKKLLTEIILYETGKIILNYNKYKDSILVNLLTKINYSRYF